jgi:hypothetical protein
MIEGATGAQHALYIFKQKRCRRDDFLPFILRYYEGGGVGRCLSTNSINMAAAVSFFINYDNKEMQKHY